MKAFYNEIDGYCCAWLSNLMDAGLITPGVISDKSIEDILPDELCGFNRVHMFAGIGIWDLALNNANWGAAEVWTGSCPCQPFSAAGAGAGFADERHLWPAFHHLIAERRPAIVLGEQVASSHVGPWIDLVHADLEALGYAFGGVPFPSAGIGAPHIRDRLYWVANASSNGLAASKIGRTVGTRQVDSGVLQFEGRFTETITGRDGKSRPCEPGFVPWVDGSPAVLGRLRAYGNAINAKAAEVFIESVLGHLVDNDFSDVI